MTDATDEQALRELRAFRPSARPMLIMIAANALLAALCLGVPYYRGKLQGEESLRAFSTFAACMLGGKPRPGMGLGLPPGEGVHFAANVMGAADDWPARCEPKLQAIAPEEAIFLWPSVKQAGADLRAVVALLRTELAQLARARASGHRGRVPERPLLALAKLRAGLTLMAQATGTGAGLDADALVFDAAPSLTQPARLPLYAGAGAALDVWLGQDGLGALAMDRRGISFMRIEGGKVDRHRVKRTSLVRATLRADDQAYIVWAMPPERCADEEDRCARRATGIARFSGEDDTLPEPTWLGGHPAGRADRSLHISLDSRVDMLARATPEGLLEMRRYQLPPETQEGAPPLDPVERWPLPEQTPPTDALLLAGARPAVAYTVTQADESRLALWRYAEDGEPGVPQVLARTTGGDPWIGDCVATTVHWLVLGGERTVQVVGIRADGATLGPHGLDAAFDDALHADDPAHDRVRLLCDDDDLRLLGIARDRALAHLRCNAEACTALPSLTTNAHDFDAVALGDAVLAAYTVGSEPQIVTTRVGAEGAVEQAPHTPAACWDPLRGMCGMPTLVTDGKRTLLSARDGSDLLTIETSDGGSTWQTMRGLKVSAAISTDVSAPMDQHRIRKGLQTH